MLVSIIVPVYNIERYIERCIKSIINQDYKDIEIILVIDGSTDRSEVICRELAQSDGRIKIVTKENGGLSSARNAGMPLARGEYILFVDGDDWVSENCISTCKQYMNNGIDIIMMGFVREYGDRKKPSYIYPDDCLFTGIEKDNLTRRLIGPVRRELSSPHSIQDINTAWGKLYKRSLIEGEKFTDTKIIGTEDLWFNLPVFKKASSIAYVHKELIHYNKENDISLTGAYNGALFDRWKVLYSYINRFVHESNFKDGIRALKNRIVVEQLPLTRNIINSNMDRYGKKKELLRILRDPIYKKAYKGFNYSDMPIYWRAFYKACEWKNIYMVSFILYVAEKIKKGV